MSANSGNRTGDEAIPPTDPSNGQGPSRGNQNKKKFFKKPNYGKDGFKPAPPRPKFSSEPPVPKALSLNNSQIVNDPLMKDNYVADPTTELFRSPDDPKIHSGTDGLTVIIDELYDKAISAKQGFNKRVPHSAFAYYCAVQTAVRQLSILSSNGKRLTPDERLAVKQIRDGKFGIPSVLATYVNGFGNTRIPGGRELRFDRPEIRSQRVQYNNVNIPGFFGKIDHTNHYLYKAYPSTGVYALRIIKDIEYTAWRPPQPNENLDDADDEFDEYGNWDLPPDVRPDIEDANYPTENLLGWRAAERLTQQQMQWLRANAQVTANRFPFMNEDVALNLTLMNAVWTELQQVEALKFDEFNVQVTGSTGQILMEESNSDRIGLIENQQQFRSYAVLDMPTTISFIAGPFRYRVRHVNNPDIQAWSIYSFDNLTNVPEMWINTRNTLIELDYPELEARRYSSHEYEPNIRIRSFVDIDSNPKKMYY